MKQPAFKGDWKEVFGEQYEVPESISKNYLDQSHKHSLCPSFLVGHKGSVEVTLWVEHPDFNTRVTNSEGKMLPKEACQPSRFLFLCVDEVTGECWTALETDDEQVAVRHAAAIREYINKGMGEDVIANPQGG